MTYNKVVSFFRSRFLSRYEIDPITGHQVSVMDLISTLENKIEKLENEINILKEENIENTNLIYELSHNMDAIDARIDIIAAQQFTRNKNV